VSTKFRDLYKQKRKHAIDLTPEEWNLQYLAERERLNEEIADAVIEKLTQQQNRRPGAPRKTAGDVQLAGKLMAKHQGNTKLARQEFSRLVCAQDDIEKKRARDRFRVALKTIQTKT
jgi:hypothetical protein